MIYFIFFLVSQFAFGHTCALLAPDAKNIEPIVKAYVVAEVTDQKYKACKELVECVSKVKGEFYIVDANFGGQPEDCWKRGLIELNSHGCREASNQIQQCLNTKLIRNTPKSNPCNSLIRQLGDLGILKKMTAKQFYIEDQSNALTERTLISACTPPKD